MSEWTSGVSDPECSESVPNTRGKGKEGAKGRAIVITDPENTGTARSRRASRGMGRTGVFEDNICQLSLSTAGLRKSWRFH